MKEFLRYRFWDWLLCGCIATGLVFPIFAGFVLEDSFSTSILWVALFMAVAMAVLVLFTYSRVTTIVGIVIGVALLLFVMVYVRGNGVFGDEAAEAANSLFIALTVAALVAVLVYLACRTKPGIIVLFLAGNILICGSYFLQFDVHVWSFLLFTFCVFVMFWYRNYLSSLQQAQVGKIRLPRFMIQSLIICFAAILLAGAAWYGIIRPLEPPTQELKLIQQLKQVTVVQKMGLYTTQKFLDPNLLSSADADQIEEGTKEGEQNGTDESDNTIEGEHEKEELTQQPQEETELIYYLLNLLNIPWILVIVVVVIAAAFILRILVRKNWKKKVDLLTPEQQVIKYYTYFLTRMERTGIRRPINYTLYEHAADIEHTLQEFSVGETDFSRLTDLYVKCFYSKNGVEDQDAELFHRFYGTFHKALRKEIGVFRYLINIFRI